MRALGQHNDGPSKAVLRLERMSLAIEGEQTGAGIREAEMSVVSPEFRGNASPHTMSAVVQCSRLQRTSAMAMAAPVARLARVP